MKLTTRIALVMMCMLPAARLFAQQPEATSEPPKRIEDVLSAPYIPTPHDVVDRMLELASITKSDLVYDLGCGDGRIVVAAAKTYGCHAVGIDIDPHRVEEAEANVKRNHVEGLVRIERGDFRKADLRKATVVVLYLSTKLNTELLPQLKMMNPGSRIVSHEFGIRWLEPDKVLRVESQEDHHPHFISLWVLR